jgi:hypothetical protein
MMNDMLEKGTASRSRDLNILRTEVPHIYGQLNDISVTGNTTLNESERTKLMQIYKTLL